MTVTANLFFSWLGQLIAAGGGGALVAIATFKFFGQSWIKHHLAKDLEAAKSEITLLASRKMKLYDQEYVVFPEVWEKLNKAFASLGSAVISYQEVPDFSQMSDVEFQDWIGRSALSDHERSFLGGADDKGRAYSRILSWRTLHEANVKFIEFHEYLQANRIFLSPDIKDKLDKIDSLIREAWVAKKMDWDGYKLNDGKSFMLEAYEKYEKQAKPIMSEIELLIQGKLFPESRA